MDAFTFVRWAVKKMKLFVLYWRRIVFAKNHFKCPWYKKIKANLCGGFLADQWMLYDFDHNDRSEYLSEFDWYRSRYINEPFDFVCNNKIASAEILKQYVEKEDCIIRWGGEEFVVIMPKTSLKQAELRAESIRMAVETMDNPVCRTTVSIGVSQYDKKDYRVAVTCADKALYEAKAGGRNCVKVYKD